jgi:hypothetical protein
VESADSLREMGSEQRHKILKMSIATGALFIVGAGLYFALGGEVWGWAIVAFGVVELATMPFIMRILDRTHAEITGQAPGVSETPQADASEQPDPSYNPYARED